MNTPLNWVRLFLMLLWIIVLILLFSGCAVASPVNVDAPKLAFALMVLGVCGVLCSIIGGFSLVKASRRR